MRERLRAWLPGWLALLLLVLWGGVNTAWLGRDHLLMDGDEMGHVGAAELYAVDLREGRAAQALGRLFSSEMGEYPPLYAAGLGLWWAAQGGSPSRPSVRSFGLLLLLATAAAVAATARRLGAGWPATLLGGAAVLWLPLNLGVSRHFMPEPMLTAAVALAMLAAVHQRQRPGVWSALGLGLIVALATLVKQSAALYLLPLLGLVRWHKSLALAPLGLLLALPWYANNMGTQGAYLWGSATHQGGADWLSHLLFYARALWRPALGPVALALLAGTLALSYRARHQASAQTVGALLRVAGIWALALLPLLLLPNKYERLLSPLLPAVGLVVAALASLGPKLSLGLSALALWSTGLSFGQAEMALPPQANEDFQQGCSQIWLRPPERDDQGIAAVVAAAKAAGPGAVLVLNGPQIPCEMQTTHPWTAHLGPALRYAGQDRALLTEPPDGQQVALVVRWGEPGVQVPGLGSFSLSGGAE